MEKLIKIGQKIVFIMLIVIFFFFLLEMFIYPFAIILFPLNVAIRCILKKESGMNIKLWRSFMCTPLFLYPLILFIAFIFKEFLENFIGKLYLNETLFLFIISEALCLINYFDIFLLNFFIIKRREGIIERKEATIGDLKIHVELLKKIFLPISLISIVGGVLSIINTFDSNQIDSLKSAIILENIPLDFFAIMSLLIATLLFCAFNYLVLNIIMHIILNIEEYMYFPVWVIRFIIDRL